MPTFPLRRRELTLLALAFLAALACLAAFAAGRGELVLLTKPAPVLLLAALLLPAPGRYTRLVVAGLAFSAAGDVLLELGPSRFLFGVGAFFVAHLCYIAAFWQAEKGLRPLAALPALLLGLLVFPRLLPGLEGQGLLVPVFLYTLALCTMVWRALARLTAAGRGADAAIWAGAWGAFAFALSDSILALERFAPGGSGIPQARFAILGLYWVGQLGITLSALRAFR